MIFRIGEMGRGGELTVWLLDRFGTTDFAKIDRMLKSGEYGENKRVCYDDDQYNDFASSSDIQFRPTTMALRNKRQLRGGPCIAPTVGESPTEFQRNDDCAGSSASHLLATVEENIAGSESESASVDEPDFRAGGKNRATPCSRIESVMPNNANSDSKESNSHLFPIPAWSTFPTAETEGPSLNPSFDAIPPDCVSNFRPGVLRSDPDCPCEMAHLQRARIFAVYGEQER